MSSAVLREVSTTMLAKVDEVIAENRDRPGALLPILQSLQREFGWLPEEAMNRVADALEISPGRIYSVITFYSLFSTSPKGKYVIRICESAPCHVDGAGEIIATLEKELGIKMGQITPDGCFSLEFTSCIGVCGVAPAIMINDEVHGNLSPGSVREILNRYE